MLSKTNTIEHELIKTLDFIESTTPSGATSIIVPSNHNNHLVKWLNEADVKHDLANAKIYHHLMYLMLSSMEACTDENFFTNMADPFELYSRGRVSNKVKFLTADEDFNVCGIELNNHGDLGLNGSKGTKLQYKDLPVRTIIGHSHAPGIEKGAYQVGTSSLLRLEYNKGLSTWHHCHCVIYPNGKRQLLFIVNGEWK
jgi:hypothetical protein